MSDIVDRLFYGDFSVIEEVNKSNDNEIIELKECIDKIRREITKIDNEEINNLLNNIQSKYNELILLYMRECFRCGVRISMEINNIK